MITDKVIKEIYKNYKKPCKNQQELQLPHFLDILKEHHNLSENNMEIIVNDLEEFNPFRRFLKRSIHAILEFDNIIAFVFRSHILFFSKDSNHIRVHMRPDEPKSLFSRIFG